MVMNEREIGQLQAQFQSMSKELEDVRDSLSEMRDTLSDLRLLVAQINGGSRMLIWLLGAAATLGGLVVGAAKYLFKTSA